MFQRHPTSGSRGGGVLVATALAESLDKPPEHQIPPDVHGDEPGQEFVPERSAGMPTPDKVLAVVLAVVTVIILIILIANFD